MLKVLIVDDETPILDWLEMCVNESGIEVSLFRARDGQEALVIIEDEKPEIIITDLVMPIIDGIELIKKIRELNIYAKIAILTCHDDFNFARNALKYDVSDYLLKNELIKNDVVNLLNRYSREIHEDLFNIELNTARSAILRENFLKSLLYSEDNTTISYDFLGKYNINLKDINYCVLCFALKDSLLKELTIEKKEFVNDVIMFTTQDNNVINIISFKKPKQEAEKKIAELVDYIKSCSVSELSIGYSEIYNKENKLVIALKQSVNMRQKLFFRSVDESLFINDKTTIKLVQLEIINRKNKIIDLYNTVNKKVSFQEVSNLLQYIQDNKIKDISFIKRCFTEIAFMIYTLSKDMNIYIDNHIQEINLSDNIIHLEHLINEFYKVVPEKKKYTDYIEKALTYLFQNYHNQISLSVVAKYVNISEEHLSRKFKKEIGQNFIDYLNNLRMKKAKILIETTDLRISEIGEIVAMSNASYFSNAFKKQFGLSPTELRGNIKK